MACWSVVCFKRMAGATAHEFVEDANVKTAAYRLRTARSDWSATVYLRR
jgi:hypothetical protein